MTQVTISENSYRRWLININMVLAKYNANHSETNLNLRSLFHKGINPENASQMIIGVKNTPEEDEIERRRKEFQENIPSWDDYFLPDFIPGES